MAGQDESVRRRVMELCKKFIRRDTDDALWRLFL